MTEDKHNTQNESKTYRNAPKKPMVIKGSKVSDMPDSRSANNKLQNWLVAILVIVLILVCAAYIFNNYISPSSQPEQTTDTQTTIPKSDSHNTEANDNALQVPESQQITTDQESATATVPDPEKILTADIPQDEALIKEEIDRLNDQEQQLVAQEQMLSEQVDTMSQLTDKKAEQIALLEKQIAQLEAKKKLP